ncbi:MAG TPA: prepilin-type N-terminal cleavage/methylation domain-containing protein [Pirellulales bacterium]|jgi:prepilin-type N-terminal cleavage/methylation domain-containing protein|nr:prepilin-type N-terminal cleavage/methylation domain-containing protein [Pirellulales bacterium]
MGTFMKSRQRRTGFTLVEAMVSLAILGIAGSAALLSLSQSVQTIDTNIRSQMALGLAEQLLDEQSGKLYMASGDNPYDTSLGPSSAEQGLPGRQYNDIDDYNGYKAQPPTDWWGVALTTDDGDGSTRDPAFQMPSGTMSRWHQQVTVCYVGDSALATPISGTSNYRLSTVQILYDDPVKGTMVLATLSRAFTYVPTP